MTATAICPTIDLVVGSLRQALAGKAWVEQHLDGRIEVLPLGGVGVMLQPQPFNNAEPRSTSLEQPRHLAG